VCGDVLPQRHLAVSLEGGEKHDGRVRADGGVRGKGDLGGTALGDVELVALGGNDDKGQLGGAKIIYKDNLCRLEDGTIAGSILRLNKGVWNVYTNSTIPLCECVNCASLNPATAIGVADRKGSIEVGKDADLVILDNEFNVLKTIIGGVVRYEA
jgi:N-acetylglucosamine-6-phosphate deacetylase